jgi:signal transduction histidine kinase
MTLARDLHDDMGSNLSHLRMLSELESLTKPDQEIFKIIATKLNEVMSNMAEIIWSTNPMHDKFSDVLNHIADYAVKTLEPLGIKVTLSNYDILPELPLNLEKKRHLYLIFKEAINNIAKYANAHSVNLSIKETKNIIQIDITDNGIGFDAELIKYGNGLINMQERAKFLNGKLTISSTANETKISLQLLK